MMHTSTILPSTLAAPRAAGSNDELEHAAPRWFVLLAMLMIFMTYMMAINQSWTASVESSFERTLDEAADSAKEGVLSRQLAFAGLGLFGAVVLWTQSGRRLRVDDPLAMWCLAYAAWCLMSCSWATEPPVSIRGLVAATCEVLAAMAITRLCTPRQFVWIVFGATASWLSLGIVAEFYHGTFRPWEGEYRFAGVFHPNDMGVVCGLLFLSALYLSSFAEERRWLLRLAMCAALVFLYLTGSRTALGCTLAVAAFGRLVLLPPRVALTVAVAGVWLAALAALLFGAALADRGASAAMLGRSEGDVASFTGRVPLWKELWPHVERSPWLGYGYNSFWTGDRIVEMTGMEWGSVTNSHSLYINSALTIGLMGAVLCVGGIVWALARAVRLERAHPLEGFGFLAVLLAYTLASGVAETTMGITKFLPLCTFAAVCLVAFRDYDGRRALSKYDTLPWLRPATRHGGSAN